MNNAEIFVQTFGIYATELWAMPEKEFLEWLNSARPVNKDAYREGYTTGWGDALQMAADLLGRIAKQRKYADAIRWTNARGEDGRSDQ